jgi:lipid II:glycine glycyltransferase (peptidoglycan interpeptide bridge formation enzyme)
MMGIESIRFSIGDDFRGSPTPESRAFFNWDFIETLSQATGYKNISITIEADGRKYILPFLERKVLGIYPIALSLPFGLYGGISSGQTMDNNLFRELTAAAKKHLGMDIIMQNPFLEKELSKTSMATLHRTYAHIIYTEKHSYDELFHSVYEYKIRKNLKRAKDSGLNIVSGNDRNIICDYYNLYILSSRRWGQSRPKYSLNFFHKFAGAHYFQVKMALYEDIPIAGLVILKFKDQSFCWFGAMNKEYANMRPNDLLYDTIIHEAIDAKIPIVNFGSSGNLPGVRKFKESLGAEEIRYTIYFNGNPIMAKGLSWLMNRNR